MNTDILFLSIYIPMWIFYLVNLASFKKFMDDYCPVLKVTTSYDVPKGHKEIKYYSKNFTFIEKLERGYFSGDDTWVPDGSKNYNSLSFERLEQN